MLFCCCLCISGHFLIFWNIGKTLFDGKNKIIFLLQSSPSGVNFHTLQQVLDLAHHTSVLAQPLPHFSPPEKYQTNHPRGVNTVTAAPPITSAVYLVNTMGEGTAKSSNKGSEEPRWGKSEARDVLYNMLMEGKIPSAKEMKPKDVHNKYLKEYRIVIIVLLLVVRM